MSLGFTILMLVKAWRSNNRPSFPTMFKTIRFLGRDTLSIVSIML